MTSIDPRIAERRREVREQRATGSLRKMLVVLALAVVVAAVVWTLRSPLFAVGRITVAGAATVPVEEILVGAGVATGMPLVTVDTGAAEEALLAHPWVKEAVVARSWPDELVVRIEERYPVAWARSGDGWVLLALDGTVLEAAPEPGDGAPVVTATGGEPVASGGRAVEGALAFLDALRADLATGASVAVGEDLVAVVVGFDVRLGAPVDMVDKARVLAAVIDTAPAAGSTITLVAPARPAIMPPGGPPPVDDGAGAEADTGAEAGAEAEAEADGG